MARKTEGTLPTDRGRGFAAPEPVPGLTLAWTSAGPQPTDRARVRDHLVVGRGADALWTIGDRRLSGRHFRARLFGSSLLVEDLGSRNGTFLDGELLDQPRPAAAGAVIRAGHCVFVVERDLEALEAARGDTAREMAGRFHSPAILANLEVAAKTERHVLIVGDSGTGKELCARWLAQRAGPNRPCVAHNCARFASVEEAQTSLFGVGRGVFSGVEPRPGLLEEADGGVLFLDEAHALPGLTQQALLRFVEDGIHARIGERSQRKRNLRLVLATNRVPESGDLAFDLVARLYRVDVPGLNERRADVPEVFLHALARESAARGFDSRVLESSLRADHFEALCRMDFAGTNVRALQQLAAELIARAAEGRLLPDDVLRMTFGQRLGVGAVVPGGRRPVEGGSLYEANREGIVAAFAEARGSLSETERVLRARGLKVNRQWLAHFLRQWGVRIGRKRPA